MPSPAPEGSATSGPRDSRSAASAATDKAPVRAPRVAFQGEPGAFSEEGVLSAFVSPEAVAVPTWRAVFEAVNDGSADAGVVPIERSAGGSVREIYDLLFKFDEIRIAAEVTVPVRLALLALPGQTLDQIERVYSIAQALDQADEFLRSRPWQVMTSYNTAGAAKSIADKREMGGAAVASARVAPLYGLEVLASDIQTGDANRTRFAVLARDPLADSWFAPATLAGPMKTTLVWAVRNVPGSLYRCLGCFAERRINLSRLESRPSRGVRWEYVFWADMDSDPEAPDCAAALAALLREAVMVRVAGVYHRAAED
ncbi:MAG: prephenate dehydratase domain-containing protein [Candidatus Limnocylindrales bacterium]|jgi:prephenate dehydratase